MSTLVTARLRGVPARQDHLADLRQLHGDPLVMRTLSAMGQPHPEAASRTRLERTLAHWQAHGFGTWFFSLRQDRDFVGYCGLRHYLVDGEAENELLYAVASNHWRQGYGLEMARAVLGYGFSGLGLRSVVAFTLAENTGSRRLMEKTGMTFEKTILHVGLPHLLYRLNSRAERG